MDLLEYGSTPDVGSSRMTTFDPPTKAMATDSFLCIPPAEGNETSISQDGNHTELLRQTSTNLRGSEPPRLSC